MMGQAFLFFFSFRMLVTKMFKTDSIRHWILKTPCLNRVTIKVKLSCSLVEAMVRQLPVLVDPPGVGVDQEFEEAPPSDWHGRSDQESR